MCAGLGSVKAARAIAYAGPMRILNEGRQNERAASDQFDIRSSKGGVLAFGYFCS